MAVVKVKLNSLYDARSPEVDDFWKDVAKMKSTGDAVVVPASANTSAVYHGLKALRGVLNRPLAIRTIDKKTYAVHL